MQLAFSALLQCSNVPCGAHAHSRQSPCIYMEKKMLTLLRNAIKRRATIHRTTTELSRLSDRELSDLGITRCDIHRVARSAL